MSRDTVLGGRIASDDAITVDVGAATERHPELLVIRNMVTARWAIFDVIASARYQFQRWFGYFATNLPGVMSNLPFSPAHWLVTVSPYNNKGNGLAVIVGPMMATGLHALNRRLERPSRCDQKVLCDDTIMDEEFVFFRSLSRD